MSNFSGTGSGFTGGVVVADIIETDDAPRMRIVIVGQNNAPLLSTPEIEFYSGNAGELAPARLVQLVSLVQLIAPQFTAGLLPRLALNSDGRIVLSDVKTLHVAPIAGSALSGNVPVVAGAESSLAGPAYNVGETGPAPSIQAGTHSGVVDVNGRQAVTFPQAFKSSVFSVVAVNGDYGTVEVEHLATASATVTGFSVSWFNPNTLTHPAGGTSRRFNWLAVGV